MPDPSWAEGYGPQTMPIHHRDGFPPRVVAQVAEVGVEDDTTARFASTGLLIPSIV